MAAESTSQAAEATSAAEMATLCCPRCGHRLLAEERLSPCSECGLGGARWAAERAAAGPFRRPKQTAMAIAMIASGVAVHAAALATDTISWRLLGALTSPAVGWIGDIGAWATAIGFLATAFAVRRGHARLAVACVVAALLAGAGAAVVGLNRGIAESLVRIPTWWADLLTRRWGAVGVTLIPIVAQACVAVGVVAIVTATLRSARIRDGEIRGVLRWAASLAAGASMAIATVLLIRSIDPRILRAVLPLSLPEIASVLRSWRWLADLPLIAAAAWAAWRTWASRVSAA